MAFCPSCGASLSGGAFCASCGNPTTSTIGALAVAAMPAPAKEHTFYDSNNVSVTNSRFVDHGKTFAMSGVTSVGSFSVPVKVMGPVVTVGIGILFALAAFPSNAGFAGFLMGLALAAIGLYWFRSRFRNQVHGVKLHSASGEQDALATKDKQFVDDVVRALNEAIVHRG